MISTEAAAALAAAQSRLAAVSARITELQTLESDLSAAIGEAVANGTDAGQLKAERAAVREEWEDAIASQSVLGTRVEVAAHVHADAERAEHAAAMAGQAAKVRSSAESYEHALVALKAAHTQFVSAGQALHELARKGGDQFATRFATAQLAEDLLQRRLYGKQNPEYEKPVPSLVGPMLDHLEAI